MPAVELVRSLVDKSRPHAARRVGPPRYLRVRGVEVIAVPPDPWGIESAVGHYLTSLLPRRRSAGEGAGAAHPGKAKKAAPTGRPSVWLASGCW